MMIYTIFGFILLGGDSLKILKANGQAFQFLQEKGLSRHFSNGVNRCKLKTSTAHSIDPAPVSTEYPACTDEALAQTDNCRRTRHSLIPVLFAASTSECGEVAGNIVRTLRSDY